MAPLRKPYCATILLATPDLPLRRCEEPPVAVLIPGDTAYCRAHYDGHRDFEERQDSWREAFVAGRARWVFL